MTEILCWTPRPDECSKEEHERMMKENMISSECRMIINGCLELDPTKRYDSTNVVGQLRSIYHEFTTN